MRPDSLLQHQVDAVPSKRLDGRLLVLSVARRVVVVHRINYLRQQPIRLTGTGIVIGALPLVIVFLVMQRSIVEGVR